MNKPKQPSIENNSQSGQNKSKDTAKKQDAPFKICGPIQDPVGDALRVFDFAKVRSSSEIKEIREGSGFTALSFKGEISSGSFLLDDLREFIPNLLEGLNHPRKQKMMNEIYAQKWKIKFQKGDSYSFYLNGSGQEENFGIQLTPMKDESEIFIEYQMGALKTTFTQASPFMIVEETRESMFRKKRVQKIVDLPPKFERKHEKELNYMKSSFFSSIIPGVNMKRSLKYQDSDDEDEEDELKKGNSYKQLKS